MYYLLENDIDRNTLFIEEYYSEVSDLSSLLVQGIFLADRNIQLELYYSDENKKNGCLRCN